jgi:hypothetical protein
MADSSSLIDDGVEFFLMKNSYFDIIGTSILLETLRKAIKRIIPGSV